MSSVVLPALALLYPKLSSPISLSKESLGQRLCHLLRKNDVTVFEPTILVLLGIFNLFKNRRGREWKVEKKRSKVKKRVNK